MSDWKVNRFAYAASEERLRSQLTSAIAADARAISYAGIMVAASAILITEAFESADPTPLVMGSVMLLFSAALAAWTARPVSFYMPGAKYSDFSDDISSNSSEDEVLRELGEFNDINSEENDKVLTVNKKAMRAAFYFAFIGVLIPAVSRAPSMF